MLFSAPAAAVELGEIEVGSHLGMPFRAAVPLSLNADETVSNLAVGLASPADYRALNVRRDPEINMISAELRGKRIELSSRYPVKAPYFTLVLRVRYRSATHFKRYPVTLDSPHALRPAKRVAATPTVVAGQVEQPAAEPAVTAKNQTEMEQADPDQAGAVEEAAATPFSPFDGWARTGRYGPTVRGDMLRVIADRLRIDERYTIGQVVVALFEKNRSNFAEQNLNLPLPESYFDVPTAEEVERVGDAQAAAVIAEHERRWRELQKQPRYAAIAEAQKSRYSHR